MKRTSDGVELATTAGVLRISTPRADTFRLQLAKTSRVQKLPSFAVEPEALKSELVPSIEESETLVLLRTPQALLRVDKQPLRITLMDAAGAVIAEDVARAHYTATGVDLDFTLAEGQHVFGLGDKARGFDRRGQRFELWNFDAFGWKVDADPLYKSIPFLVLLRQGRASGLFIDHPARATIDIGKTRADTLSYSAGQGQSLDVYLFAGPEPKQVLEAYTALTGRTPLPPLWALGHHHSRYGYLTEAEVRSVVTKMVERRIPLEAIWLDIDFQAENAPFTVNQTAFPTFTKMIADFDALGVATVAITDLHIKSYQGKPSSGYAPYDSGVAGDHFIRTSKGSFFEGPVWPGASVFPEFTRAATRAWWGGLYRDFAAQGVAGFWNDMNEPALFVPEKTFPEDVQHRLDDGTSASHSLIHNAYGSLNARATYDGLRKLRPNERPFVLTRAAYAGVQKYAASWTGDNTADRAHLGATIPQLLNLGVSGYPFNGADVGGFVGCPDAELFAEWMELGAFQPFFRNHSEKKACRREPWVFGEKTEARARKAVEARSRLLPYLYTVFEESSRNGAPVIRPLWFEYPSDPSTYDVANAYLLGPDLLVAPKLQARTGKYAVVLPAGDWYDVDAHALLSGGKHEIEAPANDSVRLFVRAGAIIPQGPVLQSARRPLKGTLTLQVWPGPHCGGALYVDDGKSFAFQSGASRRIGYGCEQGSGWLDVSARSSGDFPPWWQEVKLVLHGAPRPASKVVDASGAKLAHVHDAERKTVTVTLQGPTTAFELRATWP